MFRQFGDTENVILERLWSTTIVFDYNFLMLTQEVSLNRAKSYREKQHVLGITVLQIDAEVIRY